MASTGRMSSTDIDGAAPRVFRRARPDDAVDVALETFAGGSRVDMQALAGRLDVSPATLYRWFGSRAQLLDRVLGRLAGQFCDAAGERARGTGDERVCDYARLVMTLTAAYQPARAFVAREPQLALRLLLGREGSVHSVVAERLHALIAESRGDAAALPDERHVHLIVQVATGLVWTTLAIGEEPDVDGAVDLVGMILRAGSLAS